MHISWLRMQENKNYIIWSGCYIINLVLPLYFLWHQLSLLCLLSQRAVSFVFVCFSSFDCFWLFLNSDFDFSLMFWTLWICSSYSSLSSFSSSLFFLFPLPPLTQLRSCLRCQRAQCSKSCCCSRLYESHAFAHGLDTKNGRCFCWFSCLLPTSQ